MASPKENPFPVLKTIKEVPRGAPVVLPGLEER
jgi:hypothetical protein